MKKANGKPVGRKGARQHPSIAPLVVQTLLLLLFLSLGAGLALISSFFARQASTSKVGGKLIEYRKLELPGNAITKRENVKDFGEFSVLTKTIEPENAFARVVIYGISDNGSATEIQRIDQVSSSWTSCDQQISYPVLEIRIEPQSRVTETPQDYPSPIESGTLIQGSIGPAARASESPQRSASEESASPGSIRQEPDDNSKSKENKTKPTKIDLLIYLRRK